MESPDRKSGNSKLVYDKKNRTIVAVPAGDNVVPIEPGQPFCFYPELAAIISDMGWKMQGISLMKWDRFLTVLNAALVSACDDERTRCSNIVASYGTNDTGIQRLQQEMLDRIAFPEKK